MDTELPNECPAVDTLDLCLCLLRRLVWVGPGEGTDLKKQRRTETNANAGTTT